MVGQSQIRRPEVFLAASPIEKIHESAPPFVVVHGSADAIIPVTEARSFVERLRAVSRAKVGYIELPGLGHGFDLVDATHTAPVVAAIGRFLTQIHRDRTAVRGQGATTSPASFESRKSARIPCRTVSVTACCGGRESG